MSTATETLTPRQAEIHRWMLGYQAEHGMAPTHREIGERFGIKSPNGISCHIHALAKKGYVKIHGKALSRAAVAIDVDARRCECCGQPINDDPETGDDA